jgi:ribosomal protein S18 acetylase RimI-like enzyme
MTTVLLADLADPAHQAALLELLDMYSRNEFGAGRPLASDVRERLIPGLVKHGGARVFLAYLDERPVGLALCFVGFSSFRAQPLINVHDLAVAPPFRGRGIGRALLDAVAQHARQTDCCKVTLEVRADNATALALYRRAGFESTKPAETLFLTRPVD